MPSVYAFYSGCKRYNIPVGPKSPRYSKAQIKAVIDKIEAEGLSIAEVRSNKEMPSPSALYRAIKKYNLESPFRAHERCPNTGRFLKHKQG